MSVFYKITLQCLFVALSILSVPVQATELLLNNDPSNRWGDWEEKIFDGKTQYDWVDDASRTLPLVLKAHSKQSASGLFLEQAIDLDKTPFLSWSWKVEQSSLLEQPDHQEQTKAGDDYTLRLYIVIKDGFFFWRTRALNYVWSANQPVDSFWLSPYTKNATMAAVDSGKAHMGEWRNHKRNLKQDIKKILGLDVSTVHVVALMSDSDNTQGENTVYFGSIAVSEQ